jgi:predicted ATPase
LRNFKAAKDLPLRIGNITVLAGLNGSGKSSVLQALAVLKQSHLVPSPESLRLRGPLVQLGTYSDVHTEGAEEDLISIEVQEDGSVFRWDASGSGVDAFLPFLAKPNVFPKFLQNKNFQLLPADRIVPRNIFSRSDADTDHGFLGPRGEFVVEFLLSDLARKHVVPEVRRCPRDGHGVTEELLGKAAPTHLLLDQVSGWLQQLSPGVRVDAEALVGPDDVVLRYDYVGRSGVSESSRKIRPSNVGFGLTYSLPLVVASLVASPGSLLLLENPEAHLHPQGQAALGELLVRAAADGVQVIVETHSDHVLNGIRLAVKRRLIAANEVVIHYFTRSVEDGFVSSQSPALQDDGRLSNWPKGFFDQWDIAVDALLED